MQIHNRLQLVRTERGLSRQDLAESAGVNVQTIGFIERGDYSPSLELAFKLAYSLGVSIEQLFSDRPFPSLFTKEGDNGNE